MAPLSKTARRGIKHQVARSGKPKNDRNLDSGSKQSRTRSGRFSSVLSWQALYSDYTVMGYLTNFYRDSH